MGLERLIAVLQDIEFPDGDLPSDDIPASLRIVETCKEFFSRSWVQEMMLEMNRTNIHDRQENVYGQHVGVYSEKNAKRKQLKYYNYYETGETSESLVVVAGDDAVDIRLGEDAPRYSFELDPTAWGLQEGEVDVFAPDLLTATQNALYAHIKRNL